MRLIGFIFNTFKHGTLIMKIAIKIGSLEDTSEIITIIYLRNL